MKRVPTPVRKMTMPISFSMSLTPKSRTAVLCNSGTSRMEGATIGRPPARSIR